MSTATATLAEKLLVGLKAEPSVDLGQLSRALQEAHSRGVNAVRAAVAQGIAVESLERVAWWHQGYDIAEIDPNKVDLAPFARIPIGVAKALRVLPLSYSDSGSRQPRRGRRVAQKTGPRTRSDRCC